MWADDLRSKLSTLGTSVLWKMVCPMQWPPTSPDLTPFLGGLLRTMSITHHNGLPKTVHDVKNSAGEALTSVWRCSNHSRRSHSSLVSQWTVLFFITLFCLFLWWFGFLDWILNVHNVINAYGCKYYFRAPVLAETKFMLQILRQLREYGHKLQRLLGMTLQYT